MARIIFELIGYSIIPILFIIIANKRAKNGKSPKVFLIIFGALTVFTVLGTIVQECSSGTENSEITTLIVCFVIAVTASVSNLKNTRIMKALQEQKLMMRCC